MLRSGVTEAHKISPLKPCNFTSWFRIGIRAEHVLEFQQISRGPNCRHHVSSSVFPFIHHHPSFVFRFPESSRACLRHFLSTSHRRKMNGTPKPATPPPPRYTGGQHPSLQYSFLSPEETAAKLRTDLQGGLLDHQDYLHRRSIHGLNQLQDDEPEPLYIKFLNQFRESPLILLLLASAAVSVLMGNVDDAISITLVFPLNNVANVRLFLLC